MRRVAIAVVVACMAVSSGCASQPSVPSLDEVADERSRTITEAWQRAADAAEAYIESEWPDAVQAPLSFRRWVEPEAHLAAVLDCMDRAVGRSTGAIGPSGLLQLRPRPTKEPTWALPVAQVRCSVEVIAWSGFYPFGGPVEQEWVRHQIAVALPACVRRWGADLVIDDLDAAIDASIYPTSSDRSVDPIQSVWLSAHLRNAHDSTARQIRATCPDPGRTLTQLGPAEIRT